MLHRKSMEVEKESCVPWRSKLAEVTRNTRVRRTATFGKGTSQRMVAM